MRAVHLLGLIAAMAAPHAALACRISPWGNPRFVAEMEQSARAQFATSRAAIEAVALSGPDREGRFRMRVVRAYKGALGPGAIFYLRNPEEIVCGCTCSAMPVEPGAHGFVLLGDSEEAPAAGFVPEDIAGVYRRLIASPATSAPSG